MLSIQKGRALISEPFLNDPQFHRTVVLLSDHNAEGSVGFVINRLLSITSNEIIPDGRLISWNRRSKTKLGGWQMQMLIFYLMMIWKICGNELYKLLAMIMRIWQILLMTLDGINKYDILNKVQKQQSPIHCCIGLYHY